MKSKTESTVGAAPRDWVGRINNALAVWSHSGGDFGKGGVARFKGEGR